MTYTDTWLCNKTWQCYK